MINKRARLGIVTLVTSFTYQTTRSIDHFNFTKINT